MSALRRNAHFFSQSLMLFQGLSRYVRGWHTIWGRDIGDKKPICMLKAYG